MRSEGGNGNMRHEDNNKEDYVTDSGIPIPCTERSPPCLIADAII